MLLESEAGYGSGQSEMEFKKPYEIHRPTVNRYTVPNSGEPWLLTEHMFSSPVTYWSFIEIVFKLGGIGGAKYLTWLVLACAIDTVPGIL